MCSVVVILRNRSFSSSHGVCVKICLYVSRTIGTWFWFPEVIQHVTGESGTFHFLLIKRHLTSLVLTSHCPWGAVGHFEQCSDFLSENNFKGKHIL